MLPPRQRTGRTRLAPSLHSAAGRPISNLRFFWWMLRRPPVLRCLWRESREIPMAAPFRGAEQTRNRRLLQTAA